MHRLNEGLQGIFGGCLLIAAGVAGYLLALSRVGADSTPLDALLGQGALGWTAAVLLLAGLMAWVSGSLVALHGLSELQETHASAQRSRQPFAPAQTSGCTPSVQRTMEATPAPAASSEESRITAPADAAGRSRRTAMR
jgi:hypothetical protein